MIKVKTLEELLKEVKKENNEILVKGSILVPSPLKIARGVKIAGDGEFGHLSFSEGGLALSTDNEISNLMISASPSERAIYLESGEKDLGLIKLENLTVTGQVQILTRKPNEYLKLEIEDIDIVSADTRNRSEKPLKYGVTAHQGALTVYNYSSDKDSLIKANINNIVLGRKNAPVIGSGVFVGGFNEDGGQVELENLTTKEIYTNGYIPFGQPNIITGAIFILNGAHAHNIETKELVTTYGVNDMALDVWGEVDYWKVNAPVITYGASAIGFVNFGIVHKFVMDMPITTFGSGARGFNQYDGTIDDGTFNSIITHGDGSIGMQYSVPVNKIRVKEIITHGSEGDSLVSGVITKLKATALSIKEGGEINELIVEDSIESHGQDIPTLVIEKDGEINHLEIGGSVKNFGKGERYQINSDIAEPVMKEIKRS